MSALYWQFWPCAITEDGEKLFTQDAARSEEECIKQFEIWENHYGYKIKDAWIDTSCGTSAFDKKVFYKRTWVIDGDRNNPS